MTPLILFEYVVAILAGVGVGIAVIIFIADMFS